MIGYKLFLIGEEGQFITPYQGKSVTAPVQRAQDFDPSPAQVGPGVHAVLYGHTAIPAYRGLAWAQVRILPGTRAVVSPWAFRAEAVILEKITLLEDGKNAQRIQAVQKHWGRWCDIDVKTKEDIAQTGLTVELRYSSPVINYTGMNGSGMAWVHHLKWNKDELSIYAAVDNGRWAVFVRQKNKMKYYTSACPKKTAEIACNILKENVPAVLADNFLKFLRTVRIEMEGEEYDS